VHDPTDETSDNTKDNFYEQLQHVLKEFLKYHMNIFVRRLQCKKVRTEDNLKQQSGMRVYIKLVIMMG
jgi:hypothetical protein